MSAVDWVGSAGVFTLLLAYFLVAINVISAKSVTYTLLNLIGAVVAGVASYLLRYWPFIILEIAWSLVSLYALIEAIRIKTQQT